MNNNYVLVNCDTDSIMIAKPDNAPWTKEEQNSFLEALNAQFPEMIHFEHDGYYTEVVVIKSKNYALRLHKDWCKPKDLDENGNPKIKLKGSSIRDQKKEPALREMMEKMIDAMIYDRLGELPGIYKSYIQEVLNVTNIHRWCQKKNISRSVLDCEGWESEVRLVKNKKGEEKEKTVYFSDHADNLRMNEISVWEAVKHIEGLQENDRYYMYPVILGHKTIPGGLSEKTGKPLKDKVEEVTGLRLESQWKTGDEDKIKLLERVYATVSIFKSVLDMSQFLDYSKKSNAQHLKEIITNVGK